MSQIIVKRGAKGPHVVEIQKAYSALGLWPLAIPFSERFGPTTDRVTRKFQKLNGLVVDGKIGYSTLKTLGITVDLPKETKFNEKYRGVTILGSVFPDKPISYKLRIRFNPEMTKEYLPAMEKAMAGKAEGFKLLVTIMAYKEGFRKGTRSYRHNNPGNIGNNDSGSNKSVDSLVDGVILQRDYIESIISGKHTAYPIGKRKLIKPYYSPEIAKHSKLYGMSPYVPGYDFVFTGQLDQFVKIYATGPRAGNGYISMIVSYFKKNGIYINGQSKIQDIIKITK